ncbi:hypothetical protein AW736_16485 [Termitidicoccus mucosus]|uniref:HDOD domain-containing protein n=1 Tax=Termitidicoccus mucosus TaxID=1184151 RepID=A0A178IEM5_9BACT|nr:hypothetical protein AW736_16485 [Opitutaceae bacterium TSB47]
MVGRVKYDLAIVEPKLECGVDGLDFVRWVRASGLLGALPIVIYTRAADMVSVRAALALRPQNYLIKPYDDQAIYQEIGKLPHPRWHASLLVEEAAAAQTGGLALEEIRDERRRLADALGGMAAAWREQKEENLFQTRGDALITMARKAGAPGFAAHLSALANEAEWKLLDDDAGIERAQIAERLEHACAVLKALCGVPEDKQGAAVAEVDDGRMAREENDRRWWQSADCSAGPVISTAELMNNVAGMNACPVIESAADAFQMAVSANVASLDSISRLVARDPGLAVQILVSVNHLNREAIDPMDSPRAAVGWLGAARLQGLCRSMITVEARHFQPVTWERYWMFQVGVAHMSEFICSALEWGHLTPVAYTAGLIHDMGQLILLRLHPASYPAITNYVRNRRIARHEGERRYLGSSVREIGAEFLAAKRFPECYLNVIRWVDDPAGATDGMDIVGVVSLARYLCVKYQIGDGGECLDALPSDIHDTPAAQVLRGRVFPSFNWRGFMSQAHAKVLRLKNELRGKG